MRAPWIAAALLLAAPLVAAAETLTGKVVHVADGDTITVLVGREEVKVRLAEIDAPEHGQPWGRRAKQALVEKIAGHVVQVETKFNDRYGRRVGHVVYSDRDINREMVREGHAWVYRQWLRDETLLMDEEHARAMRAGLWGIPEAERVPPWEWRHSVRAAPVRANPPSLAPAQAVSSPSPFICGQKRYCHEMSSCEEARFYLRECHVKNLDSNADGVPCESLCRETR
jgi:endonuclease YncB( thermonuclease family)